MTFFIALFVLIMQTLWVYIDDIIGKGAGLMMITEFMFYLSISHFIMALPIAVLISTVMVMGNLAEHYELSSMKSAGISLLRIMRPLMFACVGIAAFSWLTANYLTPVANLKFKSRLYDMRNQKPTLNMETGIFNDDFEGYRIRIGEKDEDSQAIRKILIANHLSTQKDHLNEIVAEDGLMYNTPDKRYLVMELNDGQQFQEGNRYNGNQTQAPFVRTSFQKYTKVFDMSEFDISRTDEELFRTHYSMLSMRQLQVAIDSIDRQMHERLETVAANVDTYINALRVDTVATQVGPQDTTAIPAALRQRRMNEFALNPDSAKSIEAMDDEVLLANVKRVQPKVKNRVKFLKQSKVEQQEIDQPLASYETLLETFRKEKRQPYLDRASQHSRSIKNSAESANRYLLKTREKRVKHVFELYSKYSFAAVCFVFLFIGAPMGALVRKGGFGYPLLIAIIFFMLFITLTLTFKRMAEAFVVPTTLAVWLPNLIILPIGFFLTYKAMNDSKVFDAARLRSAIEQLTDRFRKRKNPSEPVA